MGDIGPHDLDLPFEEHDPIPMLDAAAAVVCGGLTVRAGTVDVPNVGLCPMLVWTFIRADGVQLQPIAFVVDDDQMAKARPLIVEAYAAAQTQPEGGDAA